MRKTVAVLATAAALLGTPVHAAVTFTYLFDDGYPISVSSDGSVVAGNGTDGNYTPFRWTQATGFVSLGRPQLVGGGGIPGVSADGKRVASSIGSLDGTYTTQGVWTTGSGWQELMPPPPADGGAVDGTYGNVYGLSGNGQMVVGLYWRPGQGNRAHASKWTQSSGVVDLGGTITGQSSRANGVNFDGSVIAGWVETPTGPWRPAAWVNGSLVLLTDYDGATLAGSGEARATSPSGDIIVGYSRDLASNQRAAAMWKRAGGVFGATEILGWVNGTQPVSGINIAQAVSSGGGIVIGYCSFDGTSFGTTGFAWTAQTGVVDVNEWLANNGVLVDPNFTIQSLTAMTPNGTQLFGYGQMLVPPYSRRAFRITNPNVVGVRSPEPVARLLLSAPRPNPSSGDTRLELTVPSAGAVDLSVFDASGRRVATLLHGDLPAGTRSVTWNGRHGDGQAVAAGLYFARLSTTRGSAVRRVIRVE